MESRREQTEEAAEMEMGAPTVVVIALTPGVAKRRWVEIASSVQRKFGGSKSRAEASI